MRNKRRGVYLTPDLVNSEGFIKLKASELQILLGFLGKAKKWKDGRKWKTNGEKIVYTFNQLSKDFGYTNRTIARAIKALLESGYLKQVRRGSADGQNVTPSVYEIPRKYLP